MAKLTLIGMYDFDDTLFDFLTLPAGIDKETLVDNILITSGDFEVLYPDADFLKMSIGAWSKKWHPTFERWQKALSIEYNPLENYDRQETWEDSHNMTGSDSGNSSGQTSGTTGSLTTNKVSAYDSGDALTTRDAIAVNGTDSTNNSGNFSNTRSQTDGGKHTGRIHGNIGVTTSQMMLISELNMGYWNIYEKITDIFLTEFVLPIY